MHESVTLAGSVHSAMKDKTWLETERTVFHKVRLGRKYVSIHNDR
ncbi:hypothetical protein PH210_17695 [Paenibacillus sp. BSR1-1]|nr:hypothetical protein [Paenibacillus sp. BSR1-1]